jgi:hypothetical protein
MSSQMVLLLMNIIFLGAFLSIGDQKIQCDSYKGVVPKSICQKLPDFKEKKI